MSLPIQLAEAMSQRGLRHAFGIPGSGASLELIDALATRGVRFHLTHFEGAAAMMAGTTGRLSGRAGVCISIKGPGLANALPGIALCHFESFPMLAVCEAYGPSAPAASVHKRLDQKALVSAVSKGRRFASRSGPGFDAMADWAEAEVPGPAVLELAGDLDTEEPIPANVEPETDAACIERARRASRPCVIAGALALRQGWGPKLAKLSVPVFTTAAAKGLVDETLPQAAGVYTGVGRERAPEGAILAEADLVVGIGLRAGEVLKTAPFPCAAVNVTAASDPASAAFGFESEAAAQDGAELLAALESKRWGVDRVAASLESLRHHLLQGPFLPAHVYEALWQRFDGRARLVMDTGDFCTIGEHAWRARSPDACLLSGQGRYMGTGVPMGIAAALHDGSMPTVIALGDGSIGMYLAELRLAVRERLPILVVLLSDGAFGSVRTRALRDGLDQSAITVDPRSWVPVLEGMGIPGDRIEESARLEAQVRSWDPRSGPAFLEVRFDADAYERMVEGIR